jgi:hypothetical protein
MIAETTETRMELVLAALATELAMAQDSCMRLDGAVGKLLASASPDQRNAVLQELAVVDHLHQHIGALGCFARQLAADSDTGRALGAITLGEVAHRLSVSLGQSVQADGDGAGEGDLDLF